MSIADVACVVLAALAMALWIPPSPRRVLERRDVGRPVRLSASLESPDDLAIRAAARRARSTVDQIATARVDRTALRDRLAVRTADRARQRLRVAWRSHGEAARWRASTVEMCTALGAELRAGAMPADAVARAVASMPGLCDEVGRIAALGGDVVPALRVAAARPGAEGLRHLAAAWLVTEITGSGLAQSCDRVVALLRDEQALRREVAAQLAGARATARLLGVLPLFGLVLGAGIGGRPWNFLLGTPYGLACLGAGLALVALGLWWTERLVRSVEAQI